MNNQMWLHSSINTKSWKEYVGKRERGRSSDQPGMDTKALADAKAGIGLLNITQIDSRAWVGYTQSGMSQVSIGLLHIESTT